MENHESRVAQSPEAATDEPASYPNSPATAVGLPDFEPAPLRYRSDGLTPETQREFVEALADTGLIHVAAARVGVSPQAIARARRRADARSFDLACAAAQRFGARRIHSIAWERAIEGTIKRHYYHGEMKSEERVFDNKLLVYLLGKTEHRLDEPPEAAAVAAQWEPWVEAMELGLPLPDIRSESEKERDERLAGYEDDADEGEEEDLDDEISDDEDRVWEDEETGVWWTSFPPPADFDGEELGEPGAEDYRRFLSDDEFEAMGARNLEGDRERVERLRRDCARRDAYFGFASGLDIWALPEGFEDEAGEKDEKDEKDGFLFAREAETSETSETSAPDEAEASLPENGQASPPPEAAAVPEAPAPAMAKLYEPSWLCTAPAPDDHSTETGAGVTGRPHE